MGKETIFKLFQDTDGCIYGLGVTSLVIILDLLINIGVAQDVAEQSPQDTDIIYRDFGKATYLSVLAIISLIFACVTAGLARLRNDNVRCDPKCRMPFVVVFAVLWI